MVLKVVILLVILTLLVDLQQAEEDPNIVFSQLPEEKSGNGPITININTITRDEPGASQLGKLFQDFTDTNQLGKLFQDMADTNQALVIFTLQTQVKDLADKHAEGQRELKALKDQVRNLTIELCRTEKDCCNKTQACPCGYEQFNEKPGICYKFSTDKKNYADARSACQADGGHLAMPKDQATNDFLEKQMKMRNHMIYVWIGLTDQVQEGTWVWDDGTTHVVGTDYGDWATGYPHSNSLLNCAHWVLPPNGVYNVQWAHFLVCHLPIFYICEVKATTSP